MAQSKERKSSGNARWLVTAWPGMGTVAVTAVVYLLSRLKMRQIEEFDAHDLFELEEAEVDDGLVHSVALPRSRLFLAEDAAPGLDIVVFLGEAQPPTGKYGLCQRLLATARKLGVTRVFCFAAWSTGMEPAVSSRVRGVATDEEGLSELRRRGVAVVGRGRITGLNGVLLAAASEAGLPGVGLLGEMPALAHQLPYPSASAAVLRAFSDIAGMTLELDELERYGRQTQEQLATAYWQAIRALGEELGEQAEETAPADAAPAEPPAPPVLEPNRIEELFAQAALDRAKAFELKNELDRLGVFRQYEDRFLALFHKP